MKIYFVTIALDAMPFITWHLPIFNQLPFDWEWHIVEGVAAPQHCTDWCKEIPRRLSQDGTTDYLASIRKHPKVCIYQQTLWDGKVSMFNAVCESLKRDGLLFQVDADELWSALNIAKVIGLFLDRPQISRMQFYCNYYVGWHIRIMHEPSGRDYGNKMGEWIRAWRFHAGDKFISHEPPKMQQKCADVLMTRDQTASEGIRFEHYAYVTEAQVLFKEQFYGYSDAVKYWKRLQANTAWPIHLRRFLPWVTDNAKAEQVGELK